ncbi:Endonuclease/exonuclease/phosphatase family protein, related [Eimeria necatrix]|uniref:Endonuclease/exonuclease/phosphatase family protein, related n=1 Tax=Eimeria necatrix TaxID=51315 RepID=U6MW24_9EIME|nr:Endonuclease/exonuclease/phosphatase family protein, related [Eimeria necatrix]CDJ66684.1 Endonuclease/exonuclease/phosphatase family protein, related [Eimeria necatrix]
MQTTRTGNMGLAGAAPTYTWGDNQASEDEEDEADAAAAAAEPAAAAAEPAAAAAEPAAAAAAAAAVKGLQLELPVSVHLKEAYGKSLLPFTNFVSNFKATLDHIFISEDLQAVGTLPGVCVEPVETLGGLLSRYYPSDHLSIAADLIQL